MRHELQEMIALGERVMASDVPGILATLFAARVRRTGRSAPR
jgi:hypothetical protein